jgi:glycosyltransferase involved in cell wall biosynthesis
MDIGIMPLTEDEYSTAKGGYKLLMYMSAGLPMVASPVGINIEIVKQDVNGFLASTSEEWYNYLKILIDNQALRNGLGQQARQEAEQKYSREICFEVMKEIMY